MIDGIPQMLAAETWRDGRLASVAEFYGKVAGVYDERCRKLEEDQAAVRDSFVQAAKAVTEEPTVLDLGCGHGRDSAVFVGEGCSVIGLDISLEMLRIAKRKSEGLFVQADIRRIPIGESLVDAVFCHSVLYHVPKVEFEPVLRNVFHVLKNNGALFLSVLNGMGETVLVREEYLNLLLPVELITQDDLIGYVRAAGFTVIDASTYEYKSKKYVDVLCRK